VSEWLKELAWKAGRRSKRRLAGSNPALSAIRVMKRTPLGRRFFARSALIVARGLLGKVLSHRKNGVLTTGRIVEVEAYLGSEDPASHAFRGKTLRNEVMFGPAGHAYVYFTYGNHFCMNVVTGKTGEASAVLIRALEPLDGISAMKRRRGRNKIEELASGPGKLTRALGIDRRQNGADLTKGSLRVVDDGTWENDCVTTPRIGITRGMDLLYRFVRSPIDRSRPRSGRCRPRRSNSRSGSR
jgi:DNA-3-methyladenine glycosylase